MVERAALAAIAPRRAAQAARPKVVVGGLGRRLEACADHDGRYLCGKSAVLVLPADDVCPDALAAWLDAPLVSAAYRALFGAHGLGAASVAYAPRQVAHLPVPTRALLGCAPARLTPMR